MLPKLKISRSASHQKLQAMTSNIATSLPILTIKKDNYLKKNRKTVARILKPEKLEVEERSVETLRNDLLQLKKQSPIKKNCTPKFKIISKSRLHNKYNSGKLQIKSQFFKMKEEEKKKVEIKSKKPEMIPVKNLTVKSGDNGPAIR